MALQQSIRNRRARAHGAARWRFVTACAAFALAGAFASCANGGSDAGGPGDDAGTGAEVTATREDSGNGLGTDDALTSDSDSSVGSPRDSSAQATDTGTAPAGDGSMQDTATGSDDGSMQDSGSPVDSSSPVDGASPVDSGGGGTDAGGPQDAGSCGGWPLWVAGTTAQQVQNMGERYTCIQPGWCDQSGTSAILAWEPGVGSDWQAAWQDSGPCP